MDAPHRKTSNKLLAYYISKPKWNAEHVKNIKNGIGHIPIVIRFPKAVK